MPARKLSVEEKYEIIQQMQMGIHHTELAKKYQCSATTINNVFKKQKTNVEYDYENNITLLLV